MPRARSILREVALGGGCFALLWGMPQLVGCDSVRLLIATTPEMSAECASLKATKDIQNFFEIPSSDRLERYTALPLEAQVEIFVYTEKCVHPAADAFVYADEIARKGRQATGVLLKRLEAEKDESIQAQLIYVLSLMPKYGLQLKNDRALMSSLRDKISAMRYHREISEKYLDEIAK